MIGTPVNVSARAALGSLSSGTRSPAMETVFSSQSRWSSSGGRDRLLLDEGAPGLRNAEQRGQWHLEPRCNHVTTVARAVDRPRRRRERRTDAGPAIPHGQTFHLELGDGGEVIELAVTSTQRGGIERDRNLSAG